MMMLTLASRNSKFKIQKAFIVGFVAVLNSMSISLPCVLDKYLKNLAS